MEPQVVELVESLQRGNVVHLRGDLNLAAGDYKVLAVRKEYVKVRKGSGKVVQLTRDRLLKVIDAEQRFRAVEGVLGAAGYQVGRDGLPLQRRRELLADLLSRPLGRLPQVGNVDEWGEAGTPTRYWKMVRCLQGFIDAAATRREKREAVSDWESDLEWLNGTFGRSFTSVISRPL